MHAFATVIFPFKLQHYWRLHNDLNTHAVLTKRNPCAEVTPPVSEKTTSLALHLHLWALLQEGMSWGSPLKARRKRTL